MTTRYSLRARLLKKWNFLHQIVLIYGRNVVLDLQITKDFLGRQNLFKIDRHLFHNVLVAVGDIKHAVHNLNSLLFAQGVVV